jgi:hypothetical protein
MSSSKTLYISWEFRKRISFITIHFMQYSLNCTVSVTARTKCYSIDEGSFVDCSIEDTKLQKEEQEGRESRGLKGLCSSDMKH